MVVHHTSASLAPYVMLSQATADTFLLSVVYFSLDITSTATLSCFPLSLFTHCSREHQNVCDRRIKQAAHVGCYDNYVTVYIETVLVFQANIPLSEGIERLWVV